MDYADLSFGERIKLLRIRRGLTLEELARKINVSNATVSRWETGQISNFKTDKLLPLAGALDTSFSYLLGLTDNPDDDDNGFNANSLDLAFQEYAKRMDALRISQELEEGIHRLSLPDEKLHMAICEAENQLLDTVHQICGMPEMTISEDFLNGTLWEKWNPQKIELVRKFIEDCRPALQKLITTLLDS